MCGVKVPLFAMKTRKFLTLVKNPFFQNEEKKSEPFKRPLFLRKQKKNQIIDCSTYHKVIIQNNVSCIIKLANFKWLVSQQMLQFTQKLTELIYWEMSKYTCVFVFMTLQVRKIPISQFHEIGFKIPLFLWNFKHTWDPKVHQRVTTGLIWVSIIIAVKVRHHRFTILFIKTWHVNILSLTYINNMHVYWPHCCSSEKSLQLSYPSHTSVAMIHLRLLHSNRLSISLQFSATHHILCLQ